jgi:hypothetical protein
MNELLPPHDFIDALGEAYELLLEKALQKAHQSGALVHHMIEESRGDIVALKKFNHEEVVKLEKYLKRDLFDAAMYLDKTENELKCWLGFDVALIKREFWERFSEAANQTTALLYQFKKQAGKVNYQSSELVGLGSLACGQCGKKLNFHRPGYIPSCAKCGSTLFHRLKY